MSGIVLPHRFVRTSLSLQSTADLLATTQSRLSTGKKVNSALDNPTNFFTAQGLDNRAGDINNLPDGIGNGVQVLQAANTGITPLQKLVDSAKSVANQARPDHHGLFCQVERPGVDHRRDRVRSARHYELHQRDRHQQRDLRRHAGGTTARRSPTRSVAASARR